LPLRSYPWEPALGGVMRPVPRSARRSATLADLAAVAAAAASAALHGAGGWRGGAAAALFAGAVVWHVSAAWERVPSLQQSPSDDEPFFATAAMQ
jgi:hypothetical protein